MPIYSVSKCSDVWEAKSLRVSPLVLSPFGLARLITCAQWYTSERKLRVFVQVRVILVGAPY